MTQAVRNMNKLPGRCLGILNGQTVVIPLGAREPLLVNAPPQGVDVVNAGQGVTIAQRLAMEVGVTLGWDQPGADPDRHKEALDDDSPSEWLYTIATPVQLTCRVRAYTDEQALALAKAIIERGEAASIPDGEAEILNTIPVEDV